MRRSFGFVRDALAEEGFAVRWYAAATISMTLLAAVFGCGSDAHTAFIAPPDESGASAGRAATAGSSATAGSGGSAAASGGEAGESGEVSAGSGGDAGSFPETGDGGAGESEAGAAPGGHAGSGGNAGGGGAAPVPMLPSAPTLLVIKVAGATSIHLSWKDNADNETGYNLYWSATATKPAQPNKKLVLDSIGADVDGLTAGQEYDFWVEAYNDLGASTDITGKATPVPVPAAPTGLTIAAGPTDAVLKWTDAAVGEAGYRIYVATSNVQPGTAQYELAADAATYTVPGSDINPYTKYFYWVVAYNAAGESMFATTSGTTGVSPAVPTGVTVDGRASMWSVAVSWQDNSAFSSSFNIYWSIDDTKPVQPGATLSGDTTTYKMKAALGNQTYRFWIESVNALGTSAAAKGTDSAPTYDLVWTDLYYDLNANTIRHAVKDTFGFLTDNDASTGLFGYHTTTQALGTSSALSPGINWNPTSAGIDITQTQSFWSEARTPSGSKFSVRALAPPGAMSAINATATNLNVGLSWAAVTPVAAYQVFLGSSATFANATAVGVQTGTTASFPDMNPGTTYNFWVRPVGAGINGYGLPGAPSTKAVTTAGTYVGPNLALGKTAVASSKQTDAAKVVDGNVTTRWQAASVANTEWIYVNLGDGNAKNITHVKLVWEAAYATSYDIQVCAATCDDNATVAVDSWAWVTAYNGPTANLTTFPNYQLVTLTTPTVGQFIRMKPKTLASNQYGASLWEFEIFSQPP